MASTPAPLPSLGLLDGLGGTAQGGGAAAPWPALGLLGGFSASAAAEEPPLRFDDGVPAAWYADVAWSESYAWQPMGITVANRADVAAGPPASVGAPAPLPHIGLLLSPVANIINAGGIASGEAFGTAVFTAGSVYSIANAGGIASGEAFGTAVISTNMVANITNAGGIASGEAFGSAAISPTFEVSGDLTRSRWRVGRRVIPSSGA